MKPLAVLAALLIFSTLKNCAQTQTIYVNSALTSAGDGS